MTQHVKLLKITQINHSAHLTVYIVRCLVRLLLRRCLLPFSCQRVQDTQMQTLPMRCSILLEKFIKRSYGFTLLKLAFGPTQQSSHRTMLACSGARALAATKHVVPVSRSVLIAKVSRRADQRRSFQARPHLGRSPLSLRASEVSGLHFARIVVLMNIAAEKLRRALQFSIPSRNLVVPGCSPICPLMQQICNRYRRIVQLQHA